MKKRTVPLSLLYFGAFAPDRPEYKTGASSTAGNLFQTNFLAALNSSRLPTAEVHSYLPMPSFPKHRKLFFWGGKDRLIDGTEVKFLPFVNLGPLKILTLGAACLAKTIQWAWRNRNSKRRIVIAYNLNAPPAWPIWLACRLSKCEFVPFIGDIYVPGEVIANTWLKRKEFELQKRMIPRVDGLLVANRAIVDDFAAGKDALLMEGGVPETYLSKFDSPHQSKKGPFHVVFAGQLSELNGVQMLLDAIRLIDGANFRFTIAGAGAMQEQVKKALASDGRISYPGLLSQADLIELYGTADVVLSLRRTDNQTHRYVFPSKVIECLATGRLLLTTCTGHAASEFESFTYLLGQETADALAKALQEISKWEPERRDQLGRAAREYVRNHRTWESNLVRLEAYLTSTQRAA